MPAVSISRDEIERKISPPICILTGEPTTHTQRQVFRCTPGWIPGLIFAAVSIRIVAGVAFGQVGMPPPCFLYVLLVPMMLIPTVAMFRLRPIDWSVPIVYRERYYWLKRMLGSAIATMTCIILILGGFTNSNEMNGIKGAPDYGLWVGRIGLLGFVALGIAFYHVRRNSIHPIEITPTHVVLANVHENFAFMLDIERKLHFQREAERHAAYLAWQQEKDAAEFAGWGSGHARARRIPSATSPTSDSDDDALLKSARDEMDAGVPEPDESSSSPAAEPRP